VDGVMEKKKTRKNKKKIDSAFYSLSHFFGPPHTLQREGSFVTHEGKEKNKRTQKRAHTPN
jgi:hypothetical protein